MPVSSARRVRSDLLLPVMLFLAAAAWLAPALAQPQAAAGFGTRAKAAVLLDADTGAIFYQSNADELLPPASVSKLMTAAVVFRALKDNRIKLTDEMTMSEHAWRTGGAPSRTSSMFVPINTPATVDDLVKGMLIQSANDAAICLAEGLGGTEDQFAKRMAVEAKRIGLTKSTFANPTRALRSRAADDGARHRPAGPASSSRNIRSSIRSSRRRTSTTGNTSSVTAIRCCSSKASAPTA